MDYLQGGTRNLARDPLSKMKNTKKESKKDDMEKDNEISELLEKEQAEDPEPSDPPSNTGEATGSNTEVAKGSATASETKTSASEESIFKLSLGQTVLFGILAVSIIFLCNSNYVSSFWKSENVSSKENSKGNSEATFFKEMNNIVAMLKNTESNLAFVNRSLTIFVKEGEHEKPAIILLLATNSSSCLLCETLKHFVSALCNYYGEEPVREEDYLRASSLKSRSSNDGKIHIEETIEKAVSSGKHVIVMEDLDKFPISSLSKVHSYLDHENAPHKDLVYILTGVMAEHQEDVKVEKYKELSKIATKHFDDQWKEYDEDHRRALMGRITSVIGYIHHKKLVDVELTFKFCGHKCNL